MSHDAEIISHFLLYYSNCFVKLWDFFLFHLLLYLFHLLLYCPNNIVTINLFIPAFFRTVK